MNIKIKNKPQYYTIKEWSVSKKTYDQLLKTINKYETVRNSLVIRKYLVSPYKIINSFTFFINNFLIFISFYKNKNQYIIRFKYPREEICQNVIHEIGRDILSRDGQEISATTQRGAKQ